MQEQYGRKESIVGHGQVDPRRKVLALRIRMFEADVRLARYADC